MSATLFYDPVAEARKYVYVREAQKLGQNRGLRVEAIQHWSGGQTADSWCMEFVWFIFDVCYQGDCPFDREQSCEDFRQLAISKGWIVTGTPRRGDLYLYVADNHAHHIGIVTEVTPKLKGIAGNTSEDGSSSNGDRVAEHSINAKVFVRVS